ncbi:MAG: GGDEF domain-containing protein [Kordiimonadaceae bacterium]|jgi:diguanylate cyclase|nr:GGDEF domain-containing protein [Kordiimonadaceae bacterium]MBT6036391.1 GGDEF domain-containing protein [Kordiimonadaceae bacterium]
MTKFLSDGDKEFIWNNSETTINKMTELEVTPTPKNYHLWYTHSAQSDLNLSKVIDNMIAKNMPFNDDLNEKLYEKFFSAEKELKAIVETGATFQRELKKIVGVLKDAGNDTSEHTKTLMEHMEKLSDFEGSSDLKDIINVVISDTDRIKEQSQQLETKLEHSTVKIEGLQTNLSNARMESRTDALTNIGNRKFFEEKINKYMTNFNKVGQDLCLILCDIDFFKKFNDSFGHQIGDQVLKVVAHVIKKELGSEGAAARYGGEEFAILLPKTQLAEGVKIAEQIRSVISKRIIKNKNTGANFGRITMSLGVANALPGITIEDLIQKADSALYLAKSNGRNMVQSELELDQIVPTQQSLSA